MNAIEIHNLKKYFKSVKAIDDISFDVKEGEIFGFLGPNGAGKSTTIRCLMDFITPTSGSISILGSDIVHDGVEARKNIGYLPSENSLHDNWTGYEHIRFIESVRGRDKNIEGLIKQFDVDPKKRIRDLSTGNRQKLGLILSLIGDPRLLILDEPTRGLDPLVQNQVQELLKKLRGEGRSIFISSHDLTEIEHICDRVGIIREGKLVAVEAIKDIRDKKMYSAHIDFVGGYDTSEFSGDGMSIISEDPTGIEIRLKGDVNRLIRILAKYEVKNVRIDRASLEEIFMEYYR